MVNVACLVKNTKGKAEIFIFNDAQNSKLDFHAFGKNALDIYAHKLAFAEAWDTFGQAREVRGKLNENTVAIDQKP